MQAHADDPARIGIDRFELPAGRVRDALPLLRNVAGEQEHEAAEGVDFILVRGG